MNGNRSIFDDFKRTFLQKGNMVITLITVNVAVFVALNLLQFIFFLFKLDGAFDAFMGWISVQADFSVLLFRPWGLITYMFTHEEIMHILFNMLWLFWFGRLLRDFLGDRRVLPVYFLGGLVGAVLFILSYNVFPAFSAVVSGSKMIGASAGVLAVVVAAATYQPNFSIYLLIIGRIQIKYIALIMVILDVVMAPDGNTGGRIAHMGGALSGFLYIRQLQSGKDWAIPMNRVFDKIAALVGGLWQPRRPRVVYRNTKSATKKTSRPARRKSNVTQDKVDSILDKISQSGYDSLTTEEKETLFKASNDDGS